MLRRSVGVGQTQWGAVAECQTLFWALGMNICKLHALQGPWVLAFRVIISPGSVWNFYILITQGPKSQEPPHLGLCIRSSVCLTYLLLLSLNLHPRKRL